MGRTLSGAATSAPRSSSRRTQSGWPFREALCSGVQSPCAPVRQATALQKHRTSDARLHVKPRPRRAPAARAHIRCGPSGQRCAAASSHPVRMHVRQQPRQARPLTHHHTRSRVRAAVQQQARAVDLALLGSGVEGCEATLRARPSGHSPAEPNRWRTSLRAATSAPRSSSRPTHSV
jgi:hypothetical protein